MPEVPVQGVEAGPVGARLMLDDDRRSVVQLVAVQSHAVDPAGQRNVDGSSDLHEQVDAQMNRPPLGQLVAVDVELSRRIDAARLVVATDADPGPSFTHFPEDRCRPRRRILGRVGAARSVVAGGLGSRVGTADPEVEDDHARTCEIGIDHGPGFRTVTVDPRHHLRRRRTWCHPTGLAHRVVREPRVDPAEAAQRLGRRAPADREVLVVRRTLLLVRGDRDAHHQAHAHQWEDGLDLLLGQWMGTVIARDHLRRCGQRIDLAQQGIGCRDGNLPDQIGVDHVAEIDDAADAVRPAIPWLDEHVVVVTVVVDHSPAYGVEARERVRLESLHEAFNDVAKARVGDVGPVVRGDPGRVLQVPVEIAVGSRVVEVVERSIEQAEVAAEIPQQVGVVRPDAGQRFARHPGQHADQVSRPIRA